MGGLFKLFLIAGTWTLTALGLTACQKTEEEITPAEKAAAEKAAADKDAADKIMALPAPAPAVLDVVTTTSEGTNTVAGSTAAGSLVVLKTSSGEIFTTIADKTGHFVITFPGNTTGSQVSVATVLSTPTILSFSNDSGVSGDGLTNDTTPTLTGTVTANTTVTILQGDLEIGTATANSSGVWTFVFPVLTTLAEGGPYVFKAKNASGESSSLSITIDTTAPTGTPGTPVLAPASDLGLLSTDRITKDNTPTYTGTSSSPNGTRIVLVEGSGGTTVLGTGTVTDGVWSITTSVLSDGVHTLVAKETDNAGNLGPASPEALTVTIDTNITSSLPDLATASDSTRPGQAGTDTDNITNDNTPTITGLSEAGAAIVLYDGSTILGNTTANGSGIWSFTPSATLDDRTYTIKATATDIAGNTKISNPLDLTIDTVAPIAGSPAFNFGPSPLSLTNLLATDPSPGTSLTYTVTAIFTGGGTFFKDTLALIPGNTFTTEDVSNIRYSGPVSSEGSITFNITDEAGNSTVSTYSTFILP